VLIANAWHHRTDAVSSVVALIAIIGSMCGAPMLDPIAGLMVAGMVALTGVQVRRLSPALLVLLVLLESARGVLRSVVVPVALLGKGSGCINYLNNLACS